MSEDTAASLWPGLPEPKVAFEFMVIIPDEDDGTLPVAPSGATVSGRTVLTWSLKARDASEAIVLGCAVAGAWAKLPGARLEVGPA